MSLCGREGRGPFTRGTPKEGSPRERPAARPAHRGFTLLELLVTTSLMALVGGATVASLGGGIRVWERTVKFGGRQQSVLLAFDRLRRDLQNVRRFRLVPFKGEYDAFQVAAVDQAIPGDESQAELGARGYFLDERRHLLCRSFVPYPLMRTTRLRDHCQPVLEHVTRVRFTYFGQREAGEAAEWAGRWESDRLPLAVKMELTVQSGEKDSSTQTLLVALAAGTFEEEKPQ